MASNQMTLNFEPSVVDRWPTLREFVAYRSCSVSKPLKTQAADMDLAPSTLSRKLNPTDGDTQRLNLDDLESWIASTCDAPAVIEYLAAKYMDSDESRKLRAVSKVEELVAELAKVMPTLREAA